MCTLLHRLEREKIHIFFFKRSFLGAIKTLPKKYEALLAYSHLNHHVKVNKVKRIVTM
jgi:hypothetical protein